jgi:NADH-quinone oxidoreductase subunit E
MTNDSLPSGQFPDAAELERLKQQMVALMPKDLTETTSLMAQPMVGAVALSALGFGMATQAFGMWMGAVAGAVEASQRAMNFDLPAGGTVADDASLPTKPTPASARAKSAVDTLIADAKVAATETVGAVARPVVKASVRPRAAKAPPVRAAKPGVAVQARSSALSKPAPMARPTQPDDLKAISGVGPKLETVLNGLGIWTYAQISGLSKGEIAWLDDYLGFKGRIDRDGWVAQAAKLGGKA